MDSQTVGALLPVWLLLVALVVEIVDLLAIGKTAPPRY